MRVLFYKHEFAWPRASGHDVHTYNMMRAMQTCGVQVGLVTRRPPPPAAVGGIEFEVLTTLDRAEPGAAPALSYFEEKFRSYWGVPSADIAAFSRVASDFHADAVVVSGLDVLPLLCGITDATRVWYAADEWCWHHASQVRPLAPSSWSELQPAIIKLAYERAYRSRLDRVWAVSTADARAFRRLAGVRAVDVLPNGVDTGWYSPLADTGAEHTAIFWGRLDFGPNVQGLEWFCRNVWPLAKQAHPDAQFTIAGFLPCERVLRLGEMPGVTVKPNVPDVRDEVRKHAVVVLPFVSGGGIKNKLLEAAAMGRAVICTTRACLGLVGTPPVTLASTVDEWTCALSTAWSDAPARRRQGDRLRTWVEAHHTWAGVAERAVAELAAAARARTRPGTGSQLLNVPAR
jgi:glycosyltransferase involved in cell wall biosynthesis